MKKARFKARNIFRSIFRNNEKIEEFILKNTKKELILDYSQLRIGLFHFLTIALPPGSVVATSAYTIFDIINIIINAKHKPHFVDISLNDLGPRIDQLIDLVQKRKVNAVIYTHLHGYNTNIEKLALICRESNCLLIEDCAQSLWDSKWSDSDILPGGYGDIALFSTGFFKNVNTISGGFLVFNKKKSYSKALLNSHKNLKNNISKDFLFRLSYGLFFKVLTNDLIFSLILFPILKFAKKHNLNFINKRAREENNPKYIERSYKDILKMNFVQKVFCKFQSSTMLRKDYFIKRKYFLIYTEKLKNLLIKGNLYIPGYKSQTNIENILKISSFNQIPIITKERDKLIKYLVAQGIDIAPQHIRNLSKTNPYLEFSENKCTNSELAANSVFLLPCYPGYSTQKIYTLCREINNFYGKNEK